MILLSMYMALVQVSVDATKNTALGERMWRNVISTNSKCIQMLQSAQFNTRADCVCDNLDYGQCESTVNATNVILMGSILLVIACVLNKLYALSKCYMDKLVKMVSIKICDNTLTFAGIMYGESYTSWGCDTSGCNDVPMLFWGVYCIMRLVSVKIMDSFMYEWVSSIVITDVLGSFIIVLLPGFLASHQYNLLPVRRRLVIWIQQSIAREFHFVWKDIQFTQIAVHVMVIIILYMLARVTAQSHAVSNITSVTFLFPAVALLFHIARCQLTKKTSSDQTQHYMNWNSFVYTFTE
jgi:hypothetical protein